MLMKSAFLGAMLASLTLFADATNLSEFRTARFGLFVHWGLYSVLGGRWRGERMEYIGEWIQSRYRIPNAEYGAMADKFNPTGFDAEAWVREAKDAGMEYLVFTSKHHEGFSMFDTQVDDYSIVKATPYRHDVLKDLSDACARNGMRFGFYYSQCLDWHEFDAADVVEMRGTNKGMDWGNSWDWPDASKKDFGRYLTAKVYPQLRELLTNYGEVFSIWFDCSMGMTKDQARELREFVRSLQPKAIVNGRIGHGLGDYGSLGDNQIVAGKSRTPVEAPVTLNDTWGFKFDDHNWKSASEIACMLAGTIACDANLLLNIGPQPDGRFPEEARTVLAKLASWRKRTGFVIKGASPNPFPQNFPWGWCSVTPDHVLQFVIRPECARQTVRIAGLRNEVLSSSVPYSQKDCALELNLPRSDDDMPRVVRVALGATPRIDSIPTVQDGPLILLPESAALRPGTAKEEKAFVGAAAERIGTGGLRLSDAGTITAWHHTGDRMQWKIRFAEPGIYKVVLTTVSTLHGGKWIGNRRIALVCDDCHVEKELTLDRNLESPIYAKGETDLGCFEVDQAKVCSVSIETLEAQVPCNLMDVDNLRVEKVK